MARFIRWLIEIWGPEGFEEVREIEPPPERDSLQMEDRDTVLTELRAEPRLRDATIYFLQDGMDGIFSVYVGVEPPEPASGEEIL